MGKSNHHTLDILKFFSDIFIISARNTPFIIIFLIMMGGVETVGMIHGRWENTDNPGDYPSFPSLFGRLAIWFLFAVIISSFIYKTKSKLLKVIIFFVVFSLYGIQHFLITNFHQPISSAYLVLIIETNSKESKDFIDTFILSDKVFPTLKNILFYTIAFLVSNYVWRKFFIPKINNHLPDKIRILFSLPFIIFVLWGLYNCKIYASIVRADSADNIHSLEKPQDPFSCLFSSIIMLKNMNSNLATAVEATQKGVESAYLNESGQKEPLNIILIIGESYIKWHSSLYGYPHETTPLLEAERDKGSLFVFNDVVTMSNKTSIVMKNILSCNNYCKSEEWFNYPYFPAIFKHVGYDVFSWDNQKETDSKANFSFTLNSFIYHPDICSLSYTHNNDHSFNYDDELVESFIEKIGKPKNLRNLIIFHLQGQHVHPASRFPQTPNNIRFTKDSINRHDSYMTPDKRQYIADYDNATLYNDKVISHIFTHFSNSSSVAIYLSDHGEEAYDYQDQFMRDHGPLTKNKIKYQYEIPFMIWCSDKYKNNHPEMIARIRNAENKPYTSNYLCHLILGLANIKTPFYINHLDLLHPDYKCGKRKIEQMYYSL